MWIESHQELGRHPKTKKLARKLGVNLPTAVGHLHLLWWWALDFAETGDLSGCEIEDIADAAEWAGGAKLFVESLTQSGFVDETEGGLVLHDWYDYAGRLLEQRKFNAERSKRKRDLYDDVELTHSVRRRDGNACRYCGKVVNWKDKKSTDGGTYDHVDPEGPNTAENIVVACRGCNSKKNRRTPEQAGMQLRSIGNLPNICPESAKDSTNICYTVPNLTLPNTEEEDNARVIESEPTDETVNQLAFSVYGASGTAAQEIEDYVNITSREVVAEALRETIANARTARAPYFRKIMTQWIPQRPKTIADVERIRAVFRQTQQPKREPRQRESAGAAYLRILAERGELVDTAASRQPA